MSLWEYANPLKFLALSDRVLPWVSVLSGVCLVVGLIGFSLHQKTTAWPEL